jgi:hypothetical protein
MPSTPFFSQFKDYFHSCKGSRPALDSCPLFLHHLQSLFSSFIPAHFLSPADQGACSRRRKWPLGLLFWTFLAQAFWLDSSCRSAVRQAQAQARLHKALVPADQTASYCLARARLPLERMADLLRYLGRTMRQRLGQGQLWCGRIIKVLDGTCLNLADTPANQKDYPQAPGQKRGCGFPIMRVMGCFCLASGALLGYTTGNYWQSELALIIHLFECLDPADVLVADRQFGCYRVLALGLSHHVDLVCRLHASRKAKFPKKPKGARSLDWQTSWKRPTKVPPGMEAKQWAALAANLTVRLVWFRVERRGFRTRQITLVTTLLDAEKYPVEALAELYSRRWRVELSFREIKTILGLEMLPNLSPTTAQRELIMRLMAYQLVRALMQQAALTAHVPLPRISFKGTLDAAIHFSYAMAQARSKKQRQELFAELLRVVAADLLPERPGRYEPRAVKRRLKAYPRLNCHRRKFREMAHRNRVLTRRAKARKNGGLI